MGVIRVPLHLIGLHSDIVSGAVFVGLQPTLPVNGISMILGNDLAGNKLRSWVTHRYQMFPVWPHRENKSITYFHHVL